MDVVHVMHRSLIKAFVKLFFSVEPVMKLNKIISANVGAFCCADIPCSVSPAKSPIELLQSKLYSFAGIYSFSPVQKLISERDDQDIFVSQHSRKPSVGCSRFLSTK